MALLLAEKRSPATRRAYRSDLHHFFGGPPAMEQVQEFVSLPAAQLAGRLNGYKAQLLEDGAAEATVNRRLAALRSLLQFSYRLGQATTDGRGLVDSEKVRAHRDTRGIDLHTMRQLIAAPGTNSVRGLRDTAMLRLLRENALRRAELCALSVGDFVPGERRLWILGKGRGTQREPITLSEPMVLTITTYLKVSERSVDPSAPLFGSLDHRPAHAGGRLTPQGLYHLVQLYGRLLGQVNLTPHKLRHSAITAALDATGGNVRKVQRLSRHAKLETLQRYDDNRTDFQGEVTQTLAALLGGCRADAELDSVR